MNGEKEWLRPSRTQRHVPNLLAVAQSERRRRNLRRTQRAIAHKAVGPNLFSQSHHRAEDAEAIAQSEELA